MCAAFSEDDNRPVVPVLVIDLSPASVDAMVEKAAAILFESEGATFIWSKHLPCGEWRRRILGRARAALSSLGIKSAKGKAGK